MLEPGDIGAGSGTLHMTTSRKEFEPFHEIGTSEVKYVHAVGVAPEHTSCTRSIEMGSFSCSPTA